MSSRIPLPYSPKILELFRNPKNLGPMKDATIQATAGSPACGDMISLYLKIKRENNKDIIEKATFESYGCAANIATASILTEMIKGKTLEEAWKISWKDLANQLGGLPAIKFHCSILAVGAFKRAVRAYYDKIKEHPSWLPKDLTREEKQTYEEEEMIEKFYKKMSKGE
ncbi:MAG: iron-sulfur cluster assembly scaffold protein [Candidatus Njordarchaeum guaymaensis]